MSSRGQQRLEKGRPLSTATQACPEGASRTCCEEKLTPHSGRERGGSTPHNLRGAFYRL